MSSLYLVIQLGSITIVESLCSPPPSRDAQDGPQQRSLVVLRHVHADAIEGRITPGRQTPTLRTEGLARPRLVALLSWCQMREGMALHRYTLGGQRDAETLERKHGILLRGSHWRARGPTRRGATNSGGASFFVPVSTPAKTRRRRPKKTTDEANRRPTTTEEVPGPNEADELISATWSAPPCARRRRRPRFGNVFAASRCKPGTRLGARSKAGGGTPSWWAWRFKETA